MSFTKKTVKDIDVKHKRVLLRTMLNVPVNNGKVSDTMRLIAAKPTIEYLLDQGARIILISHHSHEGQSFKPVAEALEEILGHDVRFLPESTGPNVERAVKALKPLDILMLENLRFHPEEEANDADFAKQLASYADIFVEDDFTVCHREHASVVGIPQYLPAVAGLNVEREVETINTALEHPKRPLVAITGGAKVSTKIPILSFLLKKVDAVFICGAMANTFMLAWNKQIGKSLAEPDQVETARKILDDAKNQDKKIILPSDVVVATKLDPPTGVRTIWMDDVGENDIIADLGPASVGQLDEVIASAGTIIWNGPAGIFETEEFAGGTKLIAEKIINSNAYTLVGGGDTADFVDNAGLHDKFSFVSTGGGASLELMSGNTLPGVEALRDKD